MAIGGFGAVALTTWWLDRLIKRETKAFRERTEVQERKLAVLFGELELARMEVSRLQSELGAVRIAVLRFIDGQPSMRLPPVAPS
jgi:hypothetical protein